MEESDPSGLDREVFLRYEEQIEKYRAAIQHAREKNTALEDKVQERAEELKKREEDHKA